MNYMLLSIWCFIFIKPIESHICNSDDLTARGILLPPFNTFDNSTKYDPQSISIAGLYLFLLLYLLMGVSIFADVFCGAIEVITSKKRDIDVRSGAIEIKTIQVYTWNNTVANLTLMAMGSSAPEIMLSLVEVIFNDFQGDVLGPATIVGSAGFNLMVIVALCVSCVPKANSDGEKGTRKIKNRGVFNITAFSSLFAYIWVAVILQANSPNEIQLWEALITFFFFPYSRICCLAY